MLMWINQALMADVLCTGDTVDHSTTEGINRYYDGFYDQSGSFYYVVNAMLWKEVLSSCSKTTKINIFSLLEKKSNVELLRKDSLTALLSTIYPISYLFL